MKRPWMPLYIADYLRKTTHLGALESGAYLHLIMDYWQNDGLPDDDKKLARIARMTDREWKAARATLQAFFHDGWQHEKIDEEIAKASEISTKRSAIASARQTAIREQAESNGSAIAPANADTLHTTQRKQDIPAGAGSSKYAFESGVIRLNQRDFEQWKQVFQHLDVPAELLAATQWASEQKSWFNALKGLLAKKNRDVKAEKERLKEQGGFKWNGGMEGVI
jgi:uncharacterized protein YdaU (DUF1376 family)